MNGRIPIISLTGVGVVSFLSRGMMEMMQQVMHLCWQRKSKNCCCWFHFGSKYKGFVRSTTILYQVRSTKYQVGDSSNKMFFFFVRNLTFGVRNLFLFVFRTSYFLLCTLYLVLCTIPHFYFVHCTWYFVQIRISYYTLFFKLHTHRIDAVPDAAFIWRSIGEAVT